MPNITPTRAWHAAENTMNDGAKRSAYMSLARLKRRYASTINFESCAESLCLFLRTQGDQNDFFDKARVAERALYPNFGSVGLNRDGNLKTALYYWQAAIDENPAIVSSVADRRLSMVRALYECQRGNNDANPDPGSTNSGVINFVDNRNPVDASVCAVGVNNKLAEAFVAMHPDVEIIDQLQDRILKLILGFIADYLIRGGKTFSDLKAADLNLSALVPADERLVIKNKVIETLGRADARYEGYMTQTELNYLEQVLSYIEELDYVSIPTAEKMQELIADTNFQLRDARLMRVQRAGYINSLNAQTPGEPIFDLRRIKEIIIDFLPRPSNQTRIHGNFGYENIFYDDTHRNFQRAAGPRYNLFGMFNYYVGCYTEEQLTVAMQPQPATINQTEVKDVRARRRIAMGGRPNFVT